MSIRRAVLDQLLSTVRSMLAGQTSERVLFLTGEAGIGKSTLLKQLTEELQSDATAPLIAQTECSTPIGGSGVGQVEALKPFADIMSRLVESGSTYTKKASPGFKLDVGKFFIDTAPSWLGMIPVLGAPIFHALAIVSSGYDQVHLHRQLRKQGNNSATSQEQVFCQYVNFLTKLTEQTPVLIILDDFHWADASSTNLLFTASRALSTAPIVFLVGYRSDDIKGTAAQDEHPLVHVRNEIERYSMSVSMHLERIDNAELQALIRDSYPDYIVSAVLESWLLRVTDGNFLFASQFLAKLEHESFIEPRTARLLKDLDTVPTPSSANAVVVEQIRRLGSDDKEQLRYASVEGETITALMMSRFLDVPIIKVLQRLRKLEEQHHVVRSLGTQTFYAKETTAFQFVHYLVHKTLYDDLTQEERSILHGVAADVLSEELAEAEASQHNINVVAARLAVHASLAERHLDAAEALLKGAQWVWKSFSADEALAMLDHCAFALDAHTAHMSDAHTVHMSDTHINSQRLSSQHARAQDVVRIRCGCLLLRASMFRMATRNGDAERCYAEVITTSTHTPAATGLQCDAYAGLSVTKRSQGRIDEAEEDARTLLRLATEVNDVRQQMVAHRLLGNTCYSRSNYDGALHAYRESLRAAEQINNIEGRASAIGNIGNILEERGDAKSALEHHRIALELHRSIYDTVAVTRGLTNIGSALHTQGAYDESMQCFEEALQLAKSCGDLRMEAVVLHNMSVIRRQQQRYEESYALLHRSLRINEHAGDRQGVAQSLGELGMICIDTNKCDEAIAHFTQSLALASELRNVYVAAIANHNIGYVHLIENRLIDAVRFLEESIEQFSGLRVGPGQVESAFALACTALKLESTTSMQISATAEVLLERTRARVLPDDFSITEYNRVFSEWTPRFEKLGIVITS